MGQPPPRRRQRRQRRRGRRHGRRVWRGRRRGRQGRHRWRPRHRAGANRAAVRAHVVDRGIRGDLLRISDEQHARTVWLVATLAAVLLGQRLGLGESEGGAGLVEGRVEERTHVAAHAFLGEAADPAWRQREGRGGGLCVRRWARGDRWTGERYGAPLLPRALAAGGQGVAATQQVRERR